MAINIVEYSVRSSILAIGEKESKIPASSRTSLKKSNIPEPKNMSVDFLVPHANFVQRLVVDESIPLGKINKDNIFPTINGEKKCISSSSFCMWNM